MNYDNITPQETISKIRTYQDRIAKLNEEYAELQQQYAFAKMEYEKHKTLRMLELKSEKMPATMIKEMIRGDEKVIDYYYAREVMEGSLDAKKAIIFSARDGLSGEQAILKWLGIEYNSSGQGGN